MDTKKPTLSAADLPSRQGFWSVGPSGICSAVDGDFETETPPGRVEMGIKNRPSEFIQKELIRVVESGKVTKYRVAKETGIRAQTIGQYCARETEINSARNLDQLCEFLGLEIRKTRRSF